LLFLPVLDNKELRPQEINSMKENTEELLANGTLEGSPLEDARSKESSTICAFPSRPDTETQQAKATAKKLKIPFVDPLSASIEPAALALLDRNVAERRQVVPIRLVNDILLVAMASPEEQIAVRSLELLTGHKIRPAAAPRSSISPALNAAYRKYPKKTAKSRKPAAVTAKEKEKKRAFNISVISNKGGVGKTHFSINLACALAKTGAKVLLIDADLGNADISNKLGLFPANHLLAFLQKNQKMEELVTPTKFGFDLICGTYGEFKLANLYYAQKVKFIKHFKRVAQGYDYAVLDLGAGIARTVLDFALGADSTVIVTTPQDLISGYACAKASFFRFKELEEKLEEKLSDYQPQLTFSPMLLLNQVADMAQGAKLFDTIYKTADENINVNEGRFSIKPQYLGAIPYDKESLRNTEEKKRPLLAGYPYIKASQCIKHMSTKFGNLDDPYNPTVKFKHSFRRFMAILSQKK
jgi:flagellar biosynthesis protein FlhG